MYRYLIYDKDGTAEDQKKDFSVNGAGTMRYLHEKKMKWIPTSYYTQKSIPDGLNTEMLRTKLYNFKRKYRRIPF